MNIGLDVDNVITDLDGKFLKEFLQEDKNKRNKGIINKNAKHITKGLFDWSEEEVQEFLNLHMEKFATELKMRKDAKFFMDKLLEDGHKLFLITHRVYPHYTNPEKTTKDWLKKHNINYTKLVMSKDPDKTQECIDNKIDVMIDDRVGQCKKMINNGIKCIIMLTKYNKADAKKMHSVSSWKKLYEVISNYAEK